MKRLLIVLCGALWLVGCTEPPPEKVEIDVDVTVEEKEKEDPPKEKEPAKVILGNEKQWDPSKM